MKIKAQELNSLLKKELHPIYLLSGEEVLLVDECCDHIRRACQQQGFSGREKHQADKSFDWQGLMDSANSLSLFEEKKLIEINLLSKPSDSGAKALMHYLASPSPDTTLLLTMQKLDAAGQRAKWFKTLDEKGVFIPIWPIEGAAFHRWIDAQLARLALSVEPDVVQFIADNTEGNLLAAKQEIDKLSLMNLPSPISLVTVTETLDNASRFTLFNLADQCLIGDLSSALTIFNQLLAEGIEWHLLLWQLTKDLRILYALNQARQKGLPTQQVFKQHRIFYAKQNHFDKAMTRINTTKAMQLLNSARAIDQAIKGISQEQPERLIQQLLFRYCQR